MLLCVWKHVPLWGRRGLESEATLNVKDRLRQLGVQGGGKEKGNFTSKRNRNKAPPPPLPTRFQVHQGSDRVKTGNTLTLACVPVLLNELLQSRQMSAPQRLPMAQPSRHKVPSQNWIQSFRLVLLQMQFLLQLSLCAHWRCFSNK